MPVRVWRVASSSCLAYEEGFSLQTILDTQEIAFLIETIPLLRFLLVKGRNQSTTEFLLKKISGFNSTKA